MRTVAPDGERDPPLLQARTEVLRPVDRIDHRDPALERRRGLRREGLFPDHPHTWQGAFKEPGHLIFQKHVGVRHGAAVGLPDDLVTERQKGRHHPFRQVDGVFQDGSDLHDNSFCGRRSPAALGRAYWLSR